MSTTLATAINLASSIVLPRATTGYTVRLASSREDVRAALRLRYLVFNLELNEGLESSHLNGMDNDQFDAVCDHLIVEHGPERQVVGTYRLQTGDHAGRHL